MSGRFCSPVSGTVFRKYAKKFFIKPLFGTKKLYRDEDESVAKAQKRKKLITEILFLRITKGILIMKDKLVQAYEAMKGGDFTSDLVKETVEEIKALPRNELGVFDMSVVSDNVYEAGDYVYPVYMLYETKANGKKGYMDLMAQLRTLSLKYDHDLSLENAAYYLDMMVKCIDAISPEIYELYRELIDMFRARMKGALIMAQGESGEAVRSIGASIEKACDMDIILAEKYLDTAKALQEVAE